MTAPGGVAPDAEAGPPGPDELVVWHLDPDVLSGPGRRERWRTILSPSERRRHARFRFERDRDLYLTGHFLVRWALSRGTEIPPERWAFAVDDRGKPRVADDAGLPPLRFNLSHTPGLVACVVALEGEVGVDVEDGTRTVDPGLPERFFSPGEVEALARAEPSRRQELFHELWTLKEAYLKARGSGLSVPLGDFTIHLEDPGPPRISFARSGDGDPSLWRFFRHRPTPRHHLAVAARRASAGRLILRPRDAAPLIDVA